MKRRNPADANNNMATARISDNTKAELREIAEKRGVTLSEVTRAAILSGLQIVKRKPATK